MDREYVSFSIKSKLPDEFQRNHYTVGFIEWEETEEAALSRGGTQRITNKTGSEVETENLDGNDETLNGDILPEKTLRIKEGESGYSYETIFGPYLKGAKRIEVVDPYIRLEYQIRNFLAFASLLDTSAGAVELHLTTAAENEFQQKYLEQKYQEMTESLARHNIHFTYQFDPVVHDRSIRCDNGWNIFPGRGFDIYQKPDSKYELSEIDQTKRKCRETEIVFQRVKE